MKEPKWLLPIVVLSIHNELLSKFGGHEGVRDEGLFDSALNRPQKKFTYEKASLFELAASYAFGLIKNHPFLDGNKRTGFTSAYVFLFINGYQLETEEAEAAAMTLSLASSEINENTYADWLKKNAVKKKNAF